ncbi:hypothetical protein [Raoultella terrigena]|uniref:hypothetical protein n=1 Tax=Raoultella terrigena TaxID=577 RepID=UPI003BF4F4D8
MSKLLREGIAFLLPKGGEPVPGQGTDQGVTAWAMDIAKREASATEQRPTNKKRKPNTKEIFFFI